MTQGESLLRGGDEATFEDTSTVAAVWTAEQGDYPLIWREANGVKRTAACWPSSCLALVVLPDPGKPVIRYSVGTAAR